MACRSSRVTRHKTAGEQTVKESRQLTRKETLDRIISALELEGLKAPGSKAGKYANIFNEVGNINHCPEIITFSPSLRKNLK